MSFYTHLQQMWGVAGRPGARDLSLLEHRVQWLLNRRPWTVRVVARVVRSIYTVHTDNLKKHHLICILGLPW